MTFTHEKIWLPRGLPAAVFSNGAEMANVAHLGYFCRYVETSKLKSSAFENQLHVSAFFGLKIYCKNDTP